MLLPVIETFIFRPVGHPNPLAFHLSVKMIALHLDNSTVIKVEENIFLSTLACHILSLADKHGITLIQTYICNQGTLGELDGLTKVTIYPLCALHSKGLWSLPL